MKKIIYYPNPVHEGRLATVITEKTVDDLITQGIIQQGDVTYAVPYNPDITSVEHILTYTHSEFLKFNNKKNPTGVVVDVAYVQEYYLTRIRELRSKILEQLDTLQFRALGKGLTKVVEAIEKDKDVLRKLTKTANVKSIMTLEDFQGILPEELQIDYIAKYESKI